MSAVWDTSTQSAKAGSGATHTFNFTPGAGVSIIIAVLHLRGIATTTPSGASATYDGVAMTAIGGVSNNTAYQRLDAFYIFNPPSGTKAVAFSWTTNACAYASANSIIGGGIPTGFLSETSAGNLSLAPSAVSNDIVMDAVTGDRGGACSFVATGAVTQVYQFQEVDTVNQTCCVGRAAGAGGATTMSWTNTYSRQSNHIAWVVPQGFVPKIMFL